MYEMCCQSGNPIPTTKALINHQQVLNDKTFLMHLKYYCDFIYLILLLSFEK